MESEYEPGICNIGRNQVLLRYVMGSIGFAAAALYVYWFLGSGLSRVFVLAVFFPLLIGFEGVFQARMSFCATFGVMGLFDFRGSGGERGRVHDPEAHRRDIRMSVKIHLYSALSAMALTVGAYLVM